MASFAAASLAAASQALTVQDALSGIFGSISMTAWIFVLLPQLLANYKAQSADGLSMTFLVTWLVGDVTNLIGALMTRLAPTAIALAVYFCFIDVVLISQAVYYNTVNARRARRLSAAAEQAEPSERSALLTRRSSADLPGSHRHHTTHEESSLEPIRKMVTGEDETPDTKPVFNNTLSVLAVCLIGAAGWFLSFKAGAWDRSDEPSAPPPPGDVKSLTHTVGLALGYTSAVLYLCARVPQILKNYREKSCEGLAVLFFILSIMGNVFYGASLISYSQDKAYLTNAIPWLVGSMGTVTEDITIFIQFRLYKDRARNTVAQA